MKKLMKIKKIKLIIGIVVIIVAFNASCLTSKGALRTYLFIHGHPVIAFITPITDDELHNKIDSEFLKTENAHCYTLTIPIKEKYTGGHMSNYIVRKNGLFYIAKYYGEA